MMGLFTPIVVRFWKQLAKPKNHKITLFYITSSLLVIIIIAMFTKLSHSMQESGASILYVYDYYYNTPTDIQF